ncbi:hypothetical protein N9176_01420 [bacterium]|nr:hypothetical protein [bacterium]
MKYFPLFLLVFFSYACKDSSVQSDKIEKEAVVVNKPTRLDSLEKISFKMFQKNPVRSISFYNEMANIYSRQDKKDKAANTHFNISKIYTQYTTDVKRASHHGHMSLGLWEQLKDTMQMANLFNYCGYLSAMEGNVDFGMLQLNKAEQLFIGLESYEGKALTYYNMARVFLVEGENEKAEQFFKLSKKYWTENFNADRVFELNNFAVKIYKQLNSATEVQKVVNENNQILKKQAISPILEAAFKELTS